MTRKDALIHLVGGACSFGAYSKHEDPKEVVDGCVALLAEIERVCPEEGDKDARLAALDRKLSAQEDVREAVAAQREKDAKIAERVMEKWCALVRDSQPSPVAEEIVAAIRGGGA